jgi:hypothetical protein
MVAKHCWAQHCSRALCEAAAAAAAVLQRICCHHLVHVVCVCVLMATLSCVAVQTRTTLHSCSGSSIVGHSTAAEHCVRLLLLLLLLLCFNVSAAIIWCMLCLCVCVS